MPPRPPASGRFSSQPSSCRRRCSGGLNLLAPFPPPGSAPRARKVEFRGFKLLIGISHCCVTRGGGDTHAAHSHTLTLAATSGSGLKGEATPPRPRPPSAPSPETPSFQARRGPGLAEARRPPEGPTGPSGHSLEGKAAAGWLRRCCLVSPLNSSQGSRAAAGGKERARAHSPRWLCTQREAVGALGGRWPA